MQNKYLRGEMSTEMMSELTAMYPNAITDWDRMKLNMLVQKRKISKKMRDILLTSLHKSFGCKRFRPGKESSTLKKQLKAIGKLRKQYYRAGLNVLEEWDVFRDGIHANLL